MKIDKKILAISWNIATEPKLYRDLSHNPYSETTQKLISERFPGKKIADVVYATILAEPEGTYSQTLQSSLRPQIPQGELSRRLDEYCDLRLKEMKGAPKEILYQDMITWVFKTGDYKEIEHDYPQNERRDIKLKIISMIENLKKTPLKHKLFKTVLGAVFIVSLLTTLQKQYVQLFGQKKQVLGTQIQKQRQALPERLIIPAIKVDALVETVGVTPEGNMDVPKNPSNVGWFGLGARPGEMGSAVMAGHVDGPYGESEIFFRLKDIKIGDDLYVNDISGNTEHFVVTRIQSYLAGFADEVFNKDDGTHLNLITCSGTWDKSKKSYSKRLVVFADIVQ